MPQKPSKDRYPPSVIGMPGYRTRHDRSGLDYIDTQSEWAHMQGYFVRHLFTGKLHLHRSLHVVVIGIAAAFFLFVAFVLFSISVVIALPFLAVGIAMAVNIVNGVKEMNQIKQVREMRSRRVSSRCIAENDDALPEETDASAPQLYQTRRARRKPFSPPDGDRNGFKHG